MKFTIRFFTYLLSGTCLLLSPVSQHIALFVPHFSVQPLEAGNMEKCSDGRAQHSAMLPNTLERFAKSLELY